VEQVSISCKAHDLPLRKWVTRKNFKRVVMVLFPYQTSVIDARKNKRVTHDSEPSKSNPHIRNTHARERPLNLLCDLPLLHPCYPPSTLYLTEPHSKTDNRNASTPFRCCSHLHVVYRMCSIQLKLSVAEDVTSGERTGGDDLASFFFPIPIS
jgi:hypothetical protein